MFEQKNDLNQIIDKIDLLSLIINQSSNKVLNFEDWKLTMSYLVTKHP